MKKAIITVVGKDRTGILARTCTYLAEAEINILDITQSVVKGYFNMMMIVDLAHANKTFDTVTGELTALGQEMGLKIGCQKAEIFEKMHRV